MRATTPNPPQSDLLSPEADGTDPSTGRRVRARFSPAETAASDAAAAAAATTPASVSFRPGPTPHDEILFPEEKGAVDRTPHDLPDACDGGLLYFCEKPVRCREEGCAPALPFSGVCLADQVSC